MSRVACYTVERTTRSKRWLRRFTYGKDYSCPNRAYGCGAMAPIEDADTVLTDDGHVGVTQPALFNGDPRWPAQCEDCGQSFAATAEWQVFTVEVHRVVLAMPGAIKSPGDLLTLRDGAAIAGAMWDAWWLGDWAAGPDGKHLMVMLPNGMEWLVDGPASNCTLPDDKVHRCWIRHGEWPNVTVDKSGNTCAAGAGSIQAGDYHGFLRGGYLEA